MNERMEINLELNNDKIQFAGRARSNERVLMDYFPPIGEGNGYTGLELLLISFAGCSSTAIVYLLRKMGKNVTGLKVYADGVRMEKPPMAFSKINIKYNLISNDASDEDFKKVLKLSEESVCPVWAMIKGNVDIIANFNIEKS